MFRNKRQPAAHTNPTTGANATPSAATAAAQAFLKQQASNASLSSAAAAAALRTHATSPEPVGSIQTKRMVRRNSNASITSNTGSVRQPFTGGGLQRRGSQSSMTERTFRSPSPSVRNGAPPVPRIPEHIPPVPSSGSHRRIASIDPPNFRVASPLPAKNGRNQSLDAGRPVNFSRPISPEPTGQSPRSPVRTRPASSLGFVQPDETQLQREIQAAHQRKLAAKGLAASPAARAATPQRMTPTPTTGPAAMTAATSAATSMAQTVASPSPQARAAQTPPQARSGVRALNPNAVLSNARMGPSAPRPIRAAQTAVPPVRPASAQSNVRPVDRNLPPVPAVVRPASALAHARPQSAQKIRDQEILAAAKAKFGVQTKSIPTSAAASSMGPVPSPSADQIKKFQNRASAMLARRPSEEPGHPSEERSRLEAVGATTATATAAAAATTAATPAESNKISSQSGTSAALATPVKTDAKQSIQSAPHLAPGSVDTGRRQSPSPTRAAHFADKPVDGGIKHEPSKRGLSPYKSAMKGHSPRSASPAGSTSKALSDTSDARSDDASTPSSKKKKSVRVSFEERPILVGEAAGVESTDDTILSPQYNKAADLDDGMGPRPTLPSFGSVRKGRSAESGENTADAAKASPTNEVLPNTQPELLDAVDDLAAAGVAKRSDTLSPPGTEPLPTGAVPAIAVIPGSPLVDEEQKEFIPSIQDKAEPEPVGRASIESAGDEVLPATDVSNADDVNLRQSVAQIVQPLSGVVPEEDEDVLAFDDSAEVPDEIDTGLGYSSLDAILESPAAEIDTEPTAKVSSADDNAPSLTAAVATDDVDVQPRAEDWSQVAAYWTGLSDQKKRQLEAEAAENEATQVDPKPNAANGKPKAGTAPLLPPWPDHEYQKSVSKGAVAAKQPTQTGTSKAASSQRANSQDGEPTGQSSLTAAATKNPLKNITKPKLTRSNSNDSSDSESSFRRMRPKKSGADGARYTMKRSMRAEPAASLDSGHPARLGMASPEPASSHKHTMRASVRGLAAESGGRSSLRASGPQSPKGSSSLFGRNKGAKGQSQSTKQSRFSSRFGDSSDEEDDRGGRGFLSRFVDSDDEDAVSPPTSPRRFRPIRGLSKKTQPADYDSSDLSDSDFERAHQPKPTRQKGRNSSVSNAAPPTTANGGVALSAGTLRSSVDSPKSKRGFLGLSKKKTDAEANVIVNSIPVNKASNEIVSPRQTPGETPTASSPKATKHSRLSRSLRKLSISSAPDAEKGEYTRGEFPFPPPPIPEGQEAAVKERPLTSDGISNLSSVRPPLNKRDSAMTAPTGAKSDKIPIISERTGKKKKFQGLRRMFGMND